MDLRVKLGRTAGVRRALVVLVMVGIAAAGTGVAGGDRTAKRVIVPGRLSVCVPVGWHVLRGWLSDVIDPAPQLAVASFPARLSHHTCECGSPNVVNFPHNGAFIFVWEYLHYPRLSLARVPRRPARLSLSAGRGMRRTCDGPDGGFNFKDAGRVFQVEVYLGPRAGAALRRRAAATLDSLRVAPAAKPRLDPEPRRAQPITWRVAFEVTAAPDDGIAVSAGGTRRERRPGRRPTAR